MVIPAYNEEARIELALVMCIASEAEEIIVVADGQDKTAEIVERLIPIYRKVHHRVLKLVKSEKRLGKGGAFFKGFEMSSGDKVFLVDADFPVPLEFVSTFSELLETYSVVIGSRYTKESVVFGQSLSRKILSKGFRWLYRNLFNLPIQDTQCGFKAFNREVLDCLKDEVKTTGMTFDLELLIKALNMGFTVKECPVTYTFGKGSKVSFRTPFKMLLETLKLYFCRRNSL